MNFVDAALAPQPKDFGNPYFYSIRAAHLGPLGYVISNPSPAVFGTLRDRVGPPAPTGHPRVDCPRVGVRATSTSPEVLGDWSGQEGFARIRLRCHRGLPDGRFDDISWVLFGVNDTSPNNPGPVALSRALFFGNGNRVEADLVIPPGAAMRATILAVHSSGLVSHLVSSEPFTVRPGLEYQHDFRAISAPIVEMIPEATVATGNLHEYWTPYFNGNLVEIANIEDAGPAAWRATFPGATSEVSRFLLIQSAGERGAWENDSSARIMPGVDEYFIRKRPGRTRFRAWLIHESPTTRDPADCPHEARPPGQESTTPIRVIIGLPIRSKEYRIYRRINDGELALLDQSTEGWDDTKVQTIVFDDALIPPAGGRIGYYGQVFDEHGNPSPLALLHERVLAMSQLPPALLEKIEPGGTAQNPTMLLRALCPSPGVARLEFIITPDAEGVPAGLTLSSKLPSVMANFAPGNSPGSPPQNFSGTYAGPTNYHRDPSEPVILEAEVPIVRGQEYQVTALTIGLNGQVGKERSALRTFTWTPPLQGNTVPWPDRPTPEVLSWHAELRAFRVEAQHLVFSQLPHYRQISTPPASYPVAIRIGRLPMGNALPRSSNNLTSRWDIWGLESTPNDITSISVGSFGLHRPAGYGPSLPPDLFHQFLYLRQIPYGEFVQPDPDSNLFPFVVYRQQIAREVFGEDETTPDTDIIQASHLVRDIIWDSNLITPRPEGEQSPPPGDFAFFSDPHTGALLTNPGQVPLRADMCYFDNTPVTEGATCQYYLLHFDGRGEPDAIINAGTVKIPMP